MLETTFGRTVTVIIVLVVFLGLGVFFLIGSGNIADGQERFGDTVKLDGADEVEAKIAMGVGELTLEGGATDLMEGDFHFLEESHKPKVSYELNGDHGKLSISQKDDIDSVFSFFNVGESEDVWHVKLNDEVPIDLDVTTGAGVSNLYLSGLNLTALHVVSGVGETVVDLSGDWSQSFDVTIKSGVGEMEVIVPEEIGVKINAKNGIGSTEVEGFIKEGSDYVNEAYENADIVLNVNVTGGIGDLTFSQK